MEESQIPSFEFNDEFKIQNGPGDALDRRAQVELTSSRGTDLNK